MATHTDSDIVGIDIGGSHITAALIDTENWILKPESHRRIPVNANDSIQAIIGAWAGIIDKILPSEKSTARVGIAMPGPFDYHNGVSYIRGQGKYDTLYGKNIRMLLANALGIPGEHIIFSNDAVCFLRGEMLKSHEQFNKVIGLTLGTGLGSSVCDNKLIVDADLWKIPFKQSILEDYLSTRWFTARYYELTGKEISNVRALINTAPGDVLQTIFDEFGTNLRSFIDQLMVTHAPDCIILGGNISKAYNLFAHQLRSLPVLVSISKLGEHASLLGAASCWNKEYAFV